MNVLWQYGVVQAKPAAAEQFDQIRLGFRVAAEIWSWVHERVKDGKETSVFRKRCSDIGVC